MSPVDHALAALTLLGPPILAVREARQLAAHPEESGFRAREYRSTLVSQVLALVVVLGWWWLAGREFAALGLTWPTGWRLALSAALTTSLIFFLIWQLRTVRRSARARREVCDQIRAAGHTQAVIPRSDDDWRWFVAVSSGAGVAEEVVYRGFLLWYAQAFLGVAAGVVVAVAAFGLAHAYQGWRGVLSTSAAGALSAAVYLITASLAAPMLMHAAIDIINGAMARLALADAPPASSQTP